MSRLKDLYTWEFSEPDEYGNQYIRIISFNGQTKTIYSGDRKYFLDDIERLEDYEYPNNEHNSLQEAVSHLIKNYYWC